MIPSRRVTAFTLIEILVVVAIIALLVAILLPSLARARETARSVVCKTHQKQLVTGMTLYMTEFKVLPCTQSVLYVNGVSYTWRNPNLKAPNLEWDGSVYPGTYTSENDPAFIFDVPNRGTLFKYARDPGVYACPAQEKGKARPSDQDPQGHGGNGRSSYSMNAYIGFKSPDSMRRPANAAGWKVRRNDASGNCDTQYSAKIWTPAEMFVLVEEHPYHSADGTPNLEGNFNVVDKIVARHNILSGGIQGRGRTNIVYLDTHVESPVVSLTTDAYQLFHKMGFPSTDGRFLGSVYGYEPAPADPNDHWGIWFPRMK